MRYQAMKLLAATALVSFGSTAVQAQEGDFAYLMGLDNNTLRGEVQSRYDAGLANSLAESFIAADDPRYLWALETKVQCGIALGYLKSSTKDETSIRKCQLAYEMMNFVSRPPASPPPPPPPPPPVVKPDFCDDEIIGTVFFEFDSAEIAPEAGTILDTIVTNIAICEWESFQIVGHTDQAGSDQYNLGLSQERAAAVTAAFAARGVGDDFMTSSAQGESNPRVPLPDGTRSPQNRRVEISAD